MDKEEAIRLLRGGPDGIEVWNVFRNEGGTVSGVCLARDGELYLYEVDLTTADLAGVNLSDANLTDANLDGANLNGANLTGADLRAVALTDANLRNATLNGANLSGVDLTGTYLRDAGLRGADLSKCKLEGADLTGADLTDANLMEAVLTAAQLNEADLSRANFTGADLSRAGFTWSGLRAANFSGSDLSGALFNESNLSTANFTGADLFRSRFIRCDLSNATVENADVTDAQFHELRGLPTPPEALYLRGQVIPLSGEDARTFFTMPARVDVFLTESLSETEIGAFYLHFAEIKVRNVASDVFLIGHRIQDRGSVLRFQSSNYEKIYRALPDLLAPFPMSRAVDWRKSLEVIPAEQRTTALMALADTAIVPTAQRWQLAERLAGFFKSTFGKAHIYRIDEGRRQGIRIDVFTNKDVAQELAGRGQSLDRAPQQVMNVVLNNTGSANLQLEGPRMGDETNTNIGGDAIGASIGARASVTAHDIIIFKQAVDHNLAQSKATDEIRVLVNQLIQQLQAIAEKIPADKARQMGADAETLSKEMAQPAPRRKWYELSIEGLKDAATAVGEVGKPILETVAKLGPLLLGA
jgi:uncharacterized protein YjbI with pentapeptide repeats